jgi:hypothetical protein
METLAKGDVQCVVRKKVRRGATAFFEEEALKEGMEQKSREFAEARCNFIQA